MDNLPKKRSLKSQRPGTKAVQEDVQGSKLSGPLVPYGSPAQPTQGEILKHLRKSVGFLRDSFPDRTREAVGATRHPEPSLQGMASASTPRVRSTQTRASGSTPEEARVPTCSLPVGAGGPGTRAQTVRSSRGSHGKWGQKARGGFARWPRGSASARCPDRAGGGPVEGGASAGGGGPSPGRGQECGLRWPRWWRKEVERARDLAGRWTCWVGLVRAF